MMNFITNLFTAVWNFAFSNQIVLFCLACLGILCFIYVSLKLLKNVGILLHKKFPRLFPSLFVILLLVFIIGIIAIGALAASTNWNKFSKGDCVIVTDKYTWQEAFRKDKLHVFENSGEIGVVRHRCRNGLKIDLIWHDKENNKVLYNVLSNKFHDEDLIKISKEEFNKRYEKLKALEKQKADAISCPS